jgi:hypothetical protein
MVGVSSLFEVYCDPFIKFNAGRIYLFYHINYLFKFWELFDTGIDIRCLPLTVVAYVGCIIVLLVLRGKPTPFLHVYHHASTLVLCWSQMRAESCMQWIPMVINLTVHVIMYVMSYHIQTACSRIHDHHDPNLIGMDISHYMHLVLNVGGRNILLAYK